MRSKIDIAWFAGLFEGEGTIWVGVDETALHLGLTDRDILERVDHLYPSSGGIKPLKSTQPHYRQAWGWGRYSAKDVREVLSDILPHLGQRRSARAMEALQLLDSRPGPNRAKTHCVRNHPLSGNNVQIDSRGWRVCLRCKQERNRSRYSKAVHDGDR